MIVVSDTSPISNLLVTGYLQILPDVYGKVIVPPAVFQELEALVQFGFDLQPLYSADWLEQMEPQNRAGVSQLLTTLDKGEAEAIVLAEEISADFLLIDERLGWKEAEARGLKTTGLLGTLVKAKDMGIITAVKPIIQALKQKTRFRMSEQLIRHVLNVAGESW